MVGSDSTLGPPGEPMSAGSTWPQAPCTLYQRSGVGSREWAWVQSQGISKIP